MRYPSFALLASTGLLLFALPLRAQEEEAEAPQAEAPKHEAAAAARNKGYHAEDATKAATQAEDDDAPAEGRPAQGSFTPPPPRQLGRSGSRANDSAGGGGGSASGGGISCEKSVPRVASVHKREINFFDKINRGNVIRYALAPHEAASWHFKTPDSGYGLIEEGMGTFATPVPMMLTISETPCDFDTVKALSKTKENIATTACYQMNPNGGSVAFQLAPLKTLGYGCVLKPNTDYYFNARALAQDGHDTCADVTLAKKSCGGIWTAHGNFKWKDEAGERKRVDFKVNDSAHIP